MRNISADAFTFKVSLGRRPFTRRGMLSILNSLCDQLGLAEEQRPFCGAWCKALQSLTFLMVHRCYTIVPSTAVRSREHHTFCNASNDAIGAVSSLRTAQHDGTIQASFVFGKAKLAPSHVITITGLELCAAGLGIEIAGLINQELDIKPDTYA